MLSPGFTAKQVLFRHLQMIAHRRACRYPIVLAYRLQDEAMALNRAFDSGARNRSRQ
jgi:hypothetical protein